MGPMYATVDMQSTAEEKQKAAPRISHYGTFVRGTCMAERDLPVVLKGSVSVSWRMTILLCGRDQCDPDSMRIESWSSVDRP